MPTQILRAGNSAELLRRDSRKTGSGADSPCQGEMSRSDKGGRVGDYEHEVLIWSRPRWRFAYFAAVGKVGRRPRAAKSPPRQIKQKSGVRVNNPPPPSAGTRAPEAL